MAGLLIVFLSGCLFSLGLGIAGMTLPQKVLAFLDFRGDWDPSLAFVMASSAGIYLVFHRWVIRRPRPVFDSEFHLPERRDIDQRLVSGAVLFGIGWGLVGLCPGPALAALVSGHEKVLIFFVSMVAGMYAFRTLDLVSGMRTPRGADVDA